MDRTKDYVFSIRFGSLIFKAVEVPKVFSGLPIGSKVNYQNKHWTVITDPITGQKILCSETSKISAN